MATPMYKAIKAINPTAQFTCVGDDYSSIVWSSGTSVISEADINAKKAELDTAYTNDEYKRKRSEAYPSIRNQLDMQYWDKKNGTTTWVDAIAKVKSDNPKP